MGKNEKHHKNGLHAYRGNTMIEVQIIPRKEYVWLEESSQ
jgi:hypothetical protein